MQPKSTGEHVQVFGIKECDFHFELWVLTDKGAQMAQTWPKQHRREKYLYDLLCTLFDDFGLRRFVESGPVGVKIATQLPGPQACLTELAWTAIRRLKAHNIINQTFFFRLAEEFPYQSPAIVTVGQLWGVWTTPP